MVARGSLLLFVVGLTAAMLQIRFLAGGWLLFIFFLPHVALGFFNVLACGWLIFGARTIERPPWKLLVFVNIAFVLSVLFQADFGDDNGWFVLTYLIGSGFGRVAQLVQFAAELAPLIDVFVLTFYGAFLANVINYTRRNFDLSEP